MTLTAATACSGIEGIGLGLERCGIPIVWNSEIEPHANAVLARHWPDVPNLGDIKLIDWSTVERPDIFAAGYPCQPFSLAGSRKGEADPRHLWPYVARAIRALRPRFVILENVPGHRSLGFDAVLGDLAACGYDAEWDGIPASSVGARHQRDRLIVVAYPHGGTVRTEPVGVFRRIGSSLAAADGVAGRVAGPTDVADAAGVGGLHVGVGGEGHHEAVEPEPRSGGRAGRRSAPAGSGEPGGSATVVGGVVASGERPVADADREGRTDTEGRGENADGRGLGPAGGGGRWAVESRVGRMPHGVPAWLDGSWERDVPRSAPRAKDARRRIKALGNACVPQVFEYVGLCLIDAFDLYDEIEFESVEAGELDALHEAEGEADDA